MKKIKLSSCERTFERPKHSALTKYIRRHGVRDNYTRDLKKILSDCDVNPHVGFLPPELRKLVKKEDIALITDQFFDRLDFLVVDKYNEFIHRTEMKYYLTEIGELFNTLCVLETYTRMPNFSHCYREWGGAVGDVYKLTFPEIHAEYALKIYKSEVYGYRGHGAKYEIPVAFCANKSEPKHNNPVYMANLFGQQYMLSKWAGEDMSDVPEDKPTSVYQTTYQEQRGENYRNKKRIDFGETYKTDYGQLSYNGRKMFRKMQNMNEKEIMLLKLQQKNNFDFADFKKAYSVYCSFYKSRY